MRLSRVAECAVAVVHAVGRLFLVVCTLSRILLPLLYSNVDEMLKKQKCAIKTCGSGTEGGGM